MTGAERGFLLLTSQLGDPERKPLTVAQFRELSLRIGSRICAEADREMDVQDFVSLGYDRKTAQYLWRLLQDTQLLEHYLLRAKKRVAYLSPGRPLPIRLRCESDWGWIVPARCGPKVMIRC